MVPTSDAPTEGNHEDTTIRVRLSEIDQEITAIDAQLGNLQRKRDLLRGEKSHLEAALAIRAGDTSWSERIDRRSPVSTDSIADEVVALLSEEKQALHFREIEKELRARGLTTGGGADPANALLAKYYNDPRLYRPRRGHYALREWAPKARSVGSRKRKGR